MSQVPSRWLNSLIQCRSFISIHFIKVRWKVRTWRSHAAHRSGGVAGGIQRAGRLNIEQPPDKLPHPCLILKIVNVARGAVRVSKGIITDEEKKNLSQFLLRRQSKSLLIELLAAVSENKSLKRGDVTVSQSASYEKIVDSIDAALKNNWMSRETLNDVLNKAEVAGRQHVYVFRVTQPNVNAVLTILRAPKQLRKQKAELEEFWDPPEKSFVRIIRDADDVFVAKIITTRKYVTEEITEESDEFEILKRSFHKERSAVIIKFDSTKRLIQFRIPPREHGGTETSKKMFKFCLDLVNQHFDAEIIGKLARDIRVSDAFPRIVDNLDDFVMEQDTPENDETRSTISAKPGPKGKIVDLRKASGWNHGSGYSRMSLRGHWKVAKDGKAEEDEDEAAQDGEEGPEESSNAEELKEEFHEAEEVFVYSHMNADKIQIDAKTSRIVCRLFVPKQCSDGDIDYVIGRILNHIG
jgi:hypothetical protein